MAEAVVVFDFDKTIIDCDSDNWVVEQFGLTDLFYQLMPTLPWNVLMDRMMEELHSQGRTTEDIAECLKRVPLHPKTISAIQSAHALGCELRILSDANHFFIEAILKHNGLVDCFLEINTNPVLVDEEGRLRILPFHDFVSSPHGCHLCPPNMCKGLVIESIRSNNDKKRFIYIGDGKGDFCPTTKLNEEDHVMPKKKYPLWEKIRSNSLLVKAEVHEWSDGEELERILLQLVANNNVASNSISAGYKVQTTPQAPSLSVVS